MRLASPPSITSMRSDGRIFSATSRATSGWLRILDRPGWSGGSGGSDPVNGFTSGEFVQGVRFGKRFYLRRIRGCGTENGVCASICTGGGETGTFPNLGASLAVWVGGLRSLRFRGMPRYKAVSAAHEQFLGLSHPVWPHFYRPQAPWAAVACRFNPWI